MRTQITKTVLLVLLAILTLAQTRAEAVNAGPSVSAQAAVLMDMDSGGSMDASLYGIDVGIPLLKYWNSNLRP